ncbi:hypothetical protein ACOT19_03865 [Acinetobacter baumannii]|uniref:hypothetical protein n=1 Tax=Acinetobacter TaxID=469 RepID=UPI00222357C7|nr:MULTISPECIES: hypothetical protein [Acinetobacter]MCW1514346.1 hypothetical protein [Acinetobacter baumannii]MDA3551910.1 hypothetical protein [Acinetobacter sp. AOR11_HL]MDA4919922.1 hypothetical protein [Acinetobacter baumannii]MDI9740491.1 hypothetical protein [Acinetobacter baumannii]HAV5495928.1 hypothetical protein [Acinetobacter baumannii]
MGSRILKDNSEVTVLDSQTENRLHAIETTLAISEAKQLKADRVWLNAGNQQYTVAFDHGADRTAFIMTRQQFENLLEGALLLDYNLPS